MARSRSIRELPVASFSMKENRKGCVERVLNICRNTYTYACARVCVCVSRAGRKTRSRTVRGSLVISHYLGIDSIQFVNLSARLSFATTFCAFCDSTPTLSRSRRGDSHAAASNRDIRRAQGRYKITKRYIFFFNKRTRSSSSDSPRYSVVYFSRRMPSSRSSRSSRYPIGVSNCVLKLGYIISRDSREYRGSLPWWSPFQGRDEKLIKRERGNYSLEIWTTLKKWREERRCECPNGPTVIFSRVGK